MTLASQDKGSFFGQWGLTALVGLPLSLILFMAPLGLGFSPIWSEETSRAAVMRIVTLGALVSPYLFWTAMMLAWPLHLRGKDWAMDMALWLLAIQFLALFLLL
ncbi:hypothetical protein ASE85_11940 [Sphingobium sp. Leaf26]|uniref:hypothetical protein n=1 Tax=Sphingobium sp. Leaf26 TaxID=1735693 RepID=UPI0006F4E13B|nr:hypothetical protein [Sphingobium sp. Leaf26]KQM98555.1 hypothetical protein ASE85_11940 [Sphingobium sp. Leaf26]